MPRTLSPDPCNLYPPSECHSVFARTNRIQTITYPDGEVVRYHYNTGGLLRRVQGEKRYNTASIDTLVPFFPHDTLVPFPHNVGDPTTDIDYNNDTVVGGDRSFFDYYYYDYIDSIRYNEFELKSGQWYGNGTHSHYRYDILQRLDSLKLYDANGHELQKIKYTYDKVGNITQISNSAAAVSSLGGTYTYTYKYDLLYRLTHSSGSVGSLKPLANYSLNMQYEADGRIIQKNQSGQTRLNGTVQTFNDSKSYSYNTSQPHTVKMIGNTNYQWDANGNMVKDGAAVLTWDEENRLVSHTKSLCSTSFFYDASGERFYKNTGSTVLLMINGEWQFMTLYTDPTLYTSPYIVATKDGYTKHYFVENERFASRIGDGTIIALNTHATTASALAAKQAKVNDAAPDSIQPDKLSNLRSLPYNWSEHHTTYWQHPDHLGSASWVTDTNGLGYQHLQYMPWGEPLLDQRKSGYTYNTRYTFSGKERDEETGYSYFGARHYHSDLSIWLSVDPMADKYPGVSPYAYCGNNPVRLVDPDGEEWVDVDGNKITDHSKIKVYIFYDPESFSGQTKQMYKDAVKKYGEGSVALSNVMTTAEFIQDWSDMSSDDIREVNLNYHGSSRTINLDYKNSQYLTSTGDGKTPLGNSAINISDLPIPSGNIRNAQLNINSCQSNGLVPEGSITIAQSFRENTTFYSIRATDKKVNYWNWTSPNRPHPEDYSDWHYLYRPVPSRRVGVGLLPY